MFSPVPSLFFCLFCRSLMTALIQVYDLETSYLQDPGQCGNVLKGFEGFLSSSKNTALYGVDFMIFLYFF